MKKIWILLLFAGLTACNKALDTVPSDFVAPDFYYNTEAELNIALTGVYDMLGKGSLYTGGDGLLTVFNVTDEMFFASNGTGPKIYDYSPSDGFVLNIWRTAYQGIERANKLLENINKPQMDESKRNVIRGEAKFLRAYFFFMLVQNFGDVPLKTTSTASVSDVNHPRTPAAQVYDFIIKEMEEAEALVQPISSFPHSGRITQSAVQGILARVCLYKAGYPNNDAARYQDALKWANKAIASGLHALNPDYAQVFINLIQNKYDTRESIWELEFYTTGVGDPYTEYGSLGITLGIKQNDQEVGFASGLYNIQKALFDLYEANPQTGVSPDLRRDWAIAPFRYKGNNGPEKELFKPTQIYDRQIGKYRREYELTAQKIKNNLGTNFPFLRYADVLLMAAEAENEVNGPTQAAYDAINLVRARAYGHLTAGGAITDHSADVPPGLSKEAFRKWIQDERARELCFEGWRRLDLVRWGIFVPAMKALANEVSLTAPAAFRNLAALPGNNVSERHIYLPIPLNEMALNKALVQNQGW